MKIFGHKNPNADISVLGFKDLDTLFWNLTVSELIEHTIQNKEGFLSDTGALVINTGEFSGRSPKDKFIVKDALTENRVDWGGFNTALSPEYFEQIFNKMLLFAKHKKLYVRDALACAHPDYTISVRVLTENSWNSLFANNMLIRPTTHQIETFEPEWHVIAFPSFKADGAKDGIRQHNFTIVDFTKKLILIGGSGYTGEIKKSIFSILNFILPVEKNVLPMHCSANVGKEGDVAIFFGLSGTGKTTLSADPNRSLIGDDEHGWSENAIFNFEGGCYAKCIDLTPEKEPDIFNAIKHGALLENTRFFENTRTVNYADATVTENTRVSYPIHFINNALFPSYSGLPKNIFFLTADAFGVLPPISKLSPGQAMFHFISGYTAKVAGTEAGVVEPQTTFSACFGAPFLPLHPTEYAQMLGKKMQENKVNVWLINTGWSGGPYGEGKRMALKYTRAMITAALNGDLAQVEFEPHPVFGVFMPKACPNVAEEVLNPRNTWQNKDAYDCKANELAEAFNKNFEKFANKASADVLAARPKITTI